MILVVLMSARERGDGGRRNVEARVGPEGDDAREDFLGDVRRELLRERRRERVRVRLLVGLETAGRLDRRSLFAAAGCLDFQGLV